MTQERMAVNTLLSSLLSGEHDDRTGWMIGCVFDAEGGTGARGDGVLVPGPDSPAPRESQSKTVRAGAPLCIFQDVGWLAIQA